MRRLVFAFARWVLGIHEYQPVEAAPGTFPPPRVRKSIWHNARGNGHGPGLSTPPDPKIEALVREHRQIRQMLADAARRCGRRSGA